MTGSTARLFSDVLSNVGTKQLGATLLALANLVFFGFGFGRSLQLAHARSWGVEVKKDLLGDLGLYFVALLTMVVFLTGPFYSSEEWAAGLAIVGDLGADPGLVRGGASPSSRSCPGS